MKQAFDRETYPLTGDWIQKQDTSHRKNPSQFMNLSPEEIRFAQN